MMIQETQIALAQNFADKQAVIRYAADMLQEHQFVDEGYLEGMLAREDQISTYLDNHIAIPHGVYEARQYVKQTGIVIIQLRRPVRWNEHKVRVVVGIAANNNDHIAILERLAMIVLNKRLAKKLAYTNRKNDFIRALVEGSPHHLAKQKTKKNVKYDYKQTVPIPKEEALHARPAAIFSQLAQQFGDEIIAEANGKVANAKSLPQVLQLAADCGQELTIAARGRSAMESVQRLVRYIETGYGGTAQSAEKAVKKQATIQDHYEGKRLSMSIANEGIAIEALYFLEDAVDVEQILAEGNGADSYSVDDEIARLNEAVQQVRDIIARVLDALGNDKHSEEQWGIFAAHLAILEDQELLQKARESISQQQKPAAQAWWDAISFYRDQMASSKTALFAERAADYQDIGERVLLILTQKDATTIQITSPCILVATELNPSTVASLPRDLIRGIVFTRGSITSHAAIIARGFGIPVLLGDGEYSEAVLHDAVGQTVIIDARAGVLVLTPTPADTERAKKLQAEYDELSQRAFQHAQSPATTHDGTTILVNANIASMDERQTLLEKGADGVGLLRTEFLFLERETPPTIKEQQESYTQLAKTCSHGDVIIRTLDVGGDKQLPYVHIDDEMNPFLGLRGIRLSFHYPYLFEDQLRAIYRTAKQHGNIKIMFPMVAEIEEFMRACEYAERIRKEEKAPEVPLGVMIEVPSMIFSLDDFSQHADFFSLGTNDLVQYLFAVDRMTAYNAIRIDFLNPIIFRTLSHIIQRTGDKPVGICGSLAQNRMVQPILLGIGIRHLSVSLPSVPLVKEYMRAYNVSACQELSRQVIDAKNSKDVKQLVQDYMNSVEI